MAEVDKGGIVSLNELIVSSLATADALAKLLIEKGLITQDEFTRMKQIPLPVPNARERCGSSVLLTSQRSLKKSFNT